MFNPRKSLLEAESLNVGKGLDEKLAITYLETGKADIRISRREFRERVVGYAAVLQSLSVKPADLVIIAHTQNLEAIYAFWGVMQVGAVPSMFPTLTEKLDPAVYMSSMEELVRLSGARLILTTEEFAPVLAGEVDCEVVGSAVFQNVKQNEKFQANYAPVPEAIAFLQHSSGTTGLQKGVALSHRAVLNQLAAYSQAIELNDQDVVVSWLPLYHDMGLIAGFLLPLVAGIPLILMSPFDWVRHPALLFKGINDYHGTLCWLPNFAYNHSARRIRERDMEGISAESMRLFINCSEPVRQTSHRQFLERFAPFGVRPDMLGVSYAMAENTFAVTQTEPGQTIRLDIIDQVALEEKGEAVPVDSSLPMAVTKVSCGPPIQGTSIRIVNNTGKALSDRRIGEVAIRSNCMLTSYYKRPDLQPFQNGWYLTGDRGYMAEGELFVIGRSKDLIINAGKNIYPQDIEAIVNGVEGIHAGRVVVFGVPDEREGTELIVVVAEVDTEDTAERKELNKRIRQEVAQKSMVTAAYVTLVEPRWLLKTSSGKIARAANRDKWLNPTRSESTAKPAEVQNNQGD
jgi:acyl-CoA synthetase (AMP-forming)/AMP-acid ligase II